jgi:AMP deaminase
MMQFVKDLLLIMDGVYANSVASFCYKRIKFLEQKYKMHEIFNHQYETTDQKAIRSKDFYNVFKVDTHIHHAAAMSAKHLLTFIKTKLDKEGDIHVNKLPNGTKIRLSDYFNEAGLKSSEISLNILDVQADKSMYKRFDRFNNKYNPLG